MKGQSLYIGISWLLATSCSIFDSNKPIDAHADSLKTSRQSFETAGFFLDNWQPSTFVYPGYTDVGKPNYLPTAIVKIDPRKKIRRISRYLNGTNANSFSGQIVDQPVLVRNIQLLAPAVIRFPGGDLSSVYFWNQNKNQRPTDIASKIYVSKDSTSDYLWYGLNNEPWTLSLENYYRLLVKTHAEGMITVNYGYARYGTSKNPVAQAAHLAADWVRHDKGRTKFWEVGNESYGHWQPGWRIDVSQNKDKQPQTMNGEIYGAHFRVFADSMRKAASELGFKIKIGAQLIGKITPNSDNPAERDWNAGYFKHAADNADYYVVHDYYTNYGENNSIETILNSAGSVTTDITRYLLNSFGVNGRQAKPVCMTEWNIFSVGSGQKVSQVAGVHAVLTLGEMLKSNFAMASRWGLLGKYANGDDFATISIGDEPDNPEKWNPRPVFFYKYYFEKFLGDWLLESEQTGEDDIVATSTQYESGETAVTLVNKGSKQQTVSVEIAGLKSGYYYYYTLKGESGNTFSRKVFVNGKGPSAVSGGPRNIESVAAQRSKISGGIKVTVPAVGVVFLIASPPA